jgi:hypothetical protein
MEFFKVLILTGVYLDASHLKPSTPITALLLVEGHSQNISHINFIFNSLLKLEVFRVSCQKYEHYIDPFKATRDCTCPITVRVKIVACAQT